VDSKIDNFKRRATGAVAALNDDERLRNRRKTDQAAADASDAIGQVIDKATRAAKELSKK
jgi:uncharacterized protein YjbJ (UPF0337 family)